MLKRLDIRVLSHLICDKPINNFREEDFLYYDKDGFELNSAEQAYYHKMGYSLSNCLNHNCFQQTWFVSENKNLIVDHCVILQRCKYDHEALRQLQYLMRTIPQANLLIKTKAKWGFDFALDSIDNDGNIFEIIHIEYDNLDYHKFIDMMILFDIKIRHTDWIDAAAKILANKDKWQHLRGFEQNNWKAKFLINWDKAEYTEKSN